MSKVLSEKDRLIVDPRLWSEINDMRQRQRRMAQEAPVLALANGSTVAVKTKKILLIGVGYVGSYLLPALRNDGYTVDACDHSGEAGVDIRYPYSHQILGELTLESYDVVLFFAGVSNVKDAKADPLNALAENAIGLVTLKSRMRPDARLIYASSGSLYSLPLDTVGKIAVPWCVEEDMIGPGLNAYDQSKAVFDHIATGFFKNTVGLRMGTVCGWSSRLRPELLFNAMCLSALREGVVRVANPMAWRSILFLDDLYAVVRACVEAADPPAILNVASGAYTMDSLGYFVARAFGVKRTYIANSPTYNFRMNTGKMHRLLFPSETKEGLLQDRCRQFVADRCRQFVADMARN